MKKTKLVMSLALAAFFLVILFPLWGHVFPQPVEESLEENREMTQWSFSGPLKKRIETLESFLDDHLAFRQTAISAVLRANLDLGESPDSSVLSGFDGWLFYVEGEEDFRRGTGLDRADLESLYSVQQQAADTFAAAGVDYRILIAPDKHSIYPQYLPLTSRLGSGPAAIGQMLSSPDPKYTVRFVDVVPALQAASQTGDQQYYKTDSHWSPNGAFTAYSVLMDALLPEHPTLHRLTADDLQRYEATTSGDLAAMIGQKGLREDHLTLVRVKNPSFREAPELSDNSLTAFVNESLPDAPRILLIHDSFGPSLTDFLRESCSVLYIMSNDSPSFDAIGDLSRFDIVIMEVVERNRSWLWSGIGSAGGDGSGEYYEEEGSYYEEEEDGEEEDYSEEEEEEYTEEEESAEQDPSR